MPSTYCMELKNPSYSTFMDATRAGAGISSANFDLSRLLAAIPNYQPSTAFREWVMRAEYDFLAELTEVECVRGWAFI